MEPQVSIQSNFNGPDGWLDEILNTLVTEVLYPPTKLDPKLPYVEKAKATILAREAEAVAMERMESDKRIVDIVRNEIRHIVEGDEDGVVYSVKETGHRAKERLAALQREQEGK